MAIRDKPTAPASPWQNGFAERLIGSIRRECVDHIVVFGEAHLRRILRTYARYYNDIRTHWSLNKDAPVSRPAQRTGDIKSPALLGGLHHHYIRVFGTHNECLSKIILFGERSLRRALSEYVAHYHAERNHQGKSNVLLFRRVAETRREEPVQCRERLGGLLRYYHQEAA